MKSRGLVGVLAHAADGCLVVREVASIDRGVSLNRALWVLAEEWRG